MDRLRVLYVSVTGRESRPYSDPSTRYRCYYPVEALRAAGHLAWVAPHDHVDEIDPSKFDAIVVHRPVFLPIMIEFLEKARKAGVTLIADYDDLIFNPRFAKASSIYKNSFNLNNAVTIFKRNTDALKLFSKFTVSTLNLAERIRELTKDAEVFHYPNCIPRSLREFIQARVFKNQVNRPNIGYFPGTKTHDIDFRECEDALSKFCRDNRIPLMIVGPLQIKEESHRDITIVRRDPVPFEDMFRLLSECRVVLAPLEGSLFNDAKSHIKLLEGSLACCTVAYTNIPDMMQHNSVAPFFVAPGGDWENVLQRSWDGSNAENAADLSEYFLREFDSETFALKFKNFFFP